MNKSMIFVSSVFEGKRHRDCFSSGVNDANNVKFLWL